MLFHSIQGAGGSSETAQEAIFTNPGTTSWVVPSGVTSVSAVCIGAGGGGCGSASGGAGGGGGDLRYYNDLAVTPGETLTITVGNSGTPGASSNGTAGGFTRIARGGTTLLEAAGGGGGTTSGSGAKSGTSTTIAGSVGGGNGGSSGNPSTVTCGGGGGAGGYSGNGGNGSATSADGGDGATNSGAAGGGGGGGDSDSAGNGGGVTVFGLGPTGQGGGGSTINGYVATGGSYGDGGLTPTAIGTGAYNTFMNFGGGGGGADNVSEAGPGGYGAVRIVWPGNTRSFPSTNIWMSDIITGGLETQSETSGVITIPLAALPGDLAVLSNMSETAGTQTDPAGWTRIVNQQLSAPVMTCWYRIIQAGDAGTTVTMTGGIAPSSELILFRKASGVVSSVTVSGATINFSTATVPAQTQTVAGGNEPVSIVFGVFSSSTPSISSHDMYFTGGVAGAGNEEPSVVFTGANGDASRQLFTRFRIYDTPPADDININQSRDPGANNMASFTLGVN